MSLIKPKSGMRKIMPNKIYNTGKIVRQPWQKTYIEFIVERAILVDRLPHGFFVYL